jgi:hypothetical protein
LLFVFGLVLTAFFVLLQPSGRAVLFPPFSAQRSNRGLTRIVLSSLAAALVGNLAVLLTISSLDVRNDGDEVGFYLAVTLFSVLFAVLFFEFAGISLRDDVAARRNSAAAAALCGFIVGEGFCLAGCNSGNGPGAEAVLFCAVISTAVLFLAWGVFDVRSGIVERVTVERDFAAGIRAGAFLASAGAIVGGSVAGNWISMGWTLWDLACFGWPTAVLLLIAVSAESIFRKRGAAASIVYAAVVFALCLGYAVRIWGLS